MDDDNKHIELTWISVHIVFHSTSIIYQNCKLLTLKPKQIRNVSVLNETIVNHMWGKQANYGIFYVRLQFQDSVTTEPKILHFLQEVHVHTVI